MAGTFCIYTNTLYITNIVVFLTAFLYVLVYLVLRYTTEMTLLKINRFNLLHRTTSFDLRQIILRFINGL